MPPIDPGDYASITLHRRSATVDDAAVDQALSSLRERAARYEPVEGRGVADGRLGRHGFVRTLAETDRTSRSSSSRRADAAGPRRAADRQARRRHRRHRRAGEPAGIRRAADRPASTAGAEDVRRAAIRTTTRSQELAGTTVNYDVTVKSIRKRVVPELDDEFAKDLGDFENLDALRARVRGDLEHEAMHEAEREIARRAAEAARRARDLRRAAVARSIARSIAGSRSSSAG